MPKSGAWSRWSCCAAHVSPALVTAMIQIESHGDPSAVSRSGAAGLMQLMPGTADLRRRQPFRPGLERVAEAAVPSRSALRYHNNVSLALAAYNAGPGAVDASVEFRRSGDARLRRARDSRASPDAIFNPPGFAAGASAPPRSCRCADSASTPSRQLPPARVGGAVRFPLGAFLLFWFLNIFFLGGRLHHQRARAVLPVDALPCSSASRRARRTRSRLPVCSERCSRSGGLPPTTRSPPCGRRASLSPHLPDAADPRRLRFRVRLLC